MSSISSISNLLPANLLSSTPQADTSSTTSTPTPASTANSTIADSYDFSSIVNQTGNDYLLNAGTLGASNSLTDMLNGSLGSDGSSSSLYDVLVSAENSQIMQSNPALVKALIQAQSDSTSSSSTTPSATSGTQGLPDLQDLNVLNMSPENLLSILQKYAQSTNSASQTTPGTLISETA